MKILYISEGNSTLLNKDTLLKKGYELVHVKELDEKTRAIEKENPDLVLLQQNNHPNLNGIAYSKKYHPSIPLLVISNKKDLSNIIYAIETGADDYMSPPVDQKELFAHIKALIRSFTCQELYLSLNTIRI